jgi:predicted transposase/invertase (TIGR01784 family)
MGANTRFKDSVFSLLFSDSDLLRELYCALEGVSLSADIPVTINTLSDALFMDMVNDISFEIGGKLVILIEHQSTINPNMALRLLMYIGRVYEKLVGGKKIYTSLPIPFPRPEFFVLYNGLSPYPDEKVLKLSEAFESTASLGIPEKGNPSLELIVKVININQGRNEGIVRKCKTLGGYSAFVGKVREYIKEGNSKEEAVKKAVVYCRAHDILKEFLEANATGVLNMLMTEWNLEDAQQVWYEDGLEVGREEGLEKGREETARNALAEGASIEFVQKITGFDIEVLKRLM